jgi:hypothetical protein
MEKKLLGDESFITMFTNRFFLRLRVSMGELCSKETGRVVLGVDVRALALMQP